MNSTRAQIVATIGPASKDKLKQMIMAGMDVARLNFSHGTYEEHRELIRLIREASGKVGKRVPIIQDLSGPREKTEGGHKFHEGTQKAFTDKDLRDLEFGLGQGVEYVCQSYIGTANDVLDLRKAMERFVSNHSVGQALVIAKIERPEGVENLNKLLKVADAVMLGRGDLGMAMPMERLPFVQHLVVRKCNRAKKPVIVATQMMLSMVEHDSPTRAEVSDVAHAILEGADAVMLSEESAIGKYPVETVAWMEKIVAEAERHLKRGWNLL